MLAFKYVKTVVQLVATACFVLQMVAAVLRYLEQPTLSSPEQKPLASLTRPILVAVCRASQFNYSKALKQEQMWIKRVNGLTNGVLCRIIPTWGIKCSGQPP